ncbi:MAG: haloacid dehalogenase, partial [Gammaproteobacteria bacterium]
MNRDPLIASSVRTLFIDMDGTLTDLAFDRGFFSEVLPRRYAEATGLDYPVAEAHVRRELEAIQGTLAWYSLAHLSQLFGLDLAALTGELA